MIDKICSSAKEAVSDIPHEAEIMVGGFGDAGVPENLLHALAGQGTRGLTIISNSAGSWERGISKLYRNNQVKKL